MTHSRLPSVAILTSAVLLVFCFAAQAAAREEQWGHWRGPLANGYAPKANPPVEWSETKNVKWKVPIPGRSHATPVVWGDKIFVLSAVNTGRKAEGAGDTAAPPPEENPGGRGRGRGRGAAPSDFHQFVVLCLDRASGRVLWQRTAREALPHEGHHPTGSYGAGSPVTDGERVYAFFGSYGLFCYDLDGKLLWEREFGKMRTFNSFGEGSTPALHDGKLIVNWDHEGNDDFIAALDAKTGQTLWKTDRDDRTTWVTPGVVVTGKETQVVIPAPGKTRGYDLATGRQIWECGGQARGNVIPVPVFAHGLVFAMSGQNGNSVQAIRLDRTGDLTGSDAVVWSLPRNAPHVPSPLLFGDHLYFLSGNNAILSCHDAASGRGLIEAERLPGLREIYASPVGAADRVYITGRDGTTLVLKHGNTVEVLATNKLDEGIDASPALAGGELFLRGSGHLYCLAVQ